MSQQIPTWPVSLQLTKGPLRLGARGAVPQRYKYIVQGADHAAAMTPPQRWGEYENHAFGLALFRFTRASSDVAQQAIAGSIFAKFRTHATFWLLMHRAQKDLSALMEESGADLSSALALAIHNDLMAGSSAVERDRDLLDMTMKGSRQGADVPHL